MWLRSAYGKASCEGRAGRLVGAAGQWKSRWLEAQRSSGGVRLARCEGCGNLGRLSGLLDRQLGSRAGLPRLATVIYLPLYFKNENHHIKINLMKDIQ